MTDDTFWVRIGHFVPNGPTVDFLVDGYPVLSEREYGDIPDYTEHKADEYEVSVQTSESAETIVSNSIRFDPGEFHTLLFVGTKVNPEFRLLTDG